MASSPSQGAHEEQLNELAPTVPPSLHLKDPDDHIGAAAITAAIEAPISFFVVLASAASGFCFGYDICVTSSALGSLADELSFNDAWRQAFVALVMVGATIGAVCSGPAAEAYGRKPVMLFLSTLFIISAGILGSAPDRTVIALGRILVGAAIGGSSVVATVYLAEVTPTRHRGLVVTLYEVALCVGCLCAFAVGAAISSWRWLLGLGAVPAVLQFIALLPLPESSHWVTARASKSRGRCASTITEAVTLCYTHPRATLLAVGVAVCQNAAFSNAILYYVDPILASLDIATPRLFALLIAVMKLMGVLGSMLCVRSCTRRRMLMIGSVAEAAAFAFVAIGAAVSPGTGRTVLVVAGLCAFVWAWNASWAPLMFVVCSEIVPLPSRAAGMAIAIAAYWLTCIATNSVLLTLLHAGSPSGFFTALTLLALAPCAFVAMLLPETGSSTLREISAAVERATFAPRSQRRPDGESEGARLVDAAAGGDNSSADDTPSAP